MIIEAQRVILELAEHVESFSYSGSYWMIEKLKRPKHLPCSNEESCFNCKKMLQDDHSKFELHAIRITGNPKLKTCECQLCQEKTNQNSKFEDKNCSFTKADLKAAGANDVCSGNSPICRSNLRAVEFI